MFRSIFNVHLQKASLICLMFKQSLASLYWFSAEEKKCTEITITGQHYTGLCNDDFSCCKNLVKLTITDTNFTDLPENLGTFPNLKILICRGNKLMKIPNSLSKLKNLHTLDLSYNQLDTIPDVINKCTNLSTLDLSNNKIKEVNNSLILLVNLKTLSLASNPIKSLDCVYKLTSLVNLDLHNIKLKELLGEIEQFKDLKNFVLRNNLLTHLPGELSTLPVLDNLDLSGNLFEEIPPQVLRMQNLTSLELQSNNIRTIPDRISNLNHLKSFNIAHNPITRLPDVFFECTACSSLILSNCNLREIPERIGCLENLRVLDVGYNHLTRLPRSMSKLNQLERLLVSNNEIREFSEELADSVAQSLRIFHCENNQLTVFPRFLRDCVNLEELNLSKNKLEDIPEFINQLKSLTSLNLCNTYLEHVPAAMGELPYLTKLLLSNNEIRDIPLEFGNLINLEDLILSCNKLSCLPANLQHLNKLKTLSLAENLFEEIPAVVCTLTALENLNMQDNMIAEFHKDLSNLKNLKVFNVSLNKIKEIPDHLKGLTSLKTLKASGNQITTVSDILKQARSIRYIYLNNNKLTGLSASLVNNLLIVNFINLHDNPLKKKPFFGTLGRDQIEDLLHSRVLVYQTKYIKTKYKKITEADVYKKVNSENPHWNVENLVSTKADFPIEATMITEDAIAQFNELIPFIGELRDTEMLQNYIQNMFTPFPDYKKMGLRPRAFNLVKNLLEFILINLNRIKNDDTRDKEQTKLLITRVLTEICDGIKTDYLIELDKLKYNPKYQSLIESTIFNVISELKINVINELKAKKKRKEIELENIKQQVQDPIFKELKRRLLILNGDLEYTTPCFCYLFDKLNTYVNKTIDEMSDLLDENVNIRRCITNALYDVFKSTDNSSVNQISAMISKYYEVLYEKSVEIQDLNESGSSEEIIDQCEPLYNLAKYHLIFAKDRVLRDQMVDVHLSPSPYVYLYWQYELRNVLGFGIHTKTECGSRGLDSFRGRPGPALNVFYNALQISGIVKELTMKINNHAHLLKIALGFLKTFDLVTEQTMIKKVMNNKNNVVEDTVNELFVMYLLEKKNYVIKQA